MQPLACAICAEGSGRLFWSPWSAEYYCASCYRGGEGDVEESELVLLDALRRQSIELRQLREAHARVVIGVWDEIGEERMIGLLGGMRWASHLRNTLDQIRKR